MYSFKHGEPQVLDKENINWQFQPILQPNNSNKIKIKAKLIRHSNKWMFKKTKHKIVKIKLKTFQIKHINRTVKINQ